MSAAQKGMNPVEQFAEIITQSGCHDDAKSLYGFFDHNIDTLPAEELRRFLIADSSILPRILARIRLDRAFQPVLQLGWHLLYRSTIDRDPQQSELSRDKRLFCKLLLLEDAALTDLAMTLFKLVTPFLRPQVWMVTMNTDRILMDAALEHLDSAVQALEVLGTLLQQTRKEGHSRRMARMLGPLHRMNTALFSLKQAFMQKAATSRDDGLARSWTAIWMKAAVVIERISASAPAECVADETARELIQHCYTMPLSSTRFADRQISQFRSDSVLLEVLSELAGNGVKFNKQYIDAVRGGYDTEMIMFRTAVMLICKLPEEKLRRIVANKNLNSVMAIRRCASDLNWYYVPKPMRVCSADGCDKRGESFGECSACGIAEYCSGQCQRNDWLKHKPMCVSWRQKTTT